MMGHQSNYQHKPFLTNFNLEKRICKDHILRKITEKIDFDFIYKEVEGTYGSNGNVSVPPPVILKMMLLLILNDTRSERELMLTIPERLDWLWFLGYDLDDEIPNHSVLSKARARWRRLWRMEIQDFLIAAIQNITILIKQPKGRLSKSNIQTVEHIKYLKREMCSSLIRSFMTVIVGRFNIALWFR